jgi:hypothetical protein
MLSTPFVTSMPGIPRSVFRLRSAFQLLTARPMLSLPSIWKTSPPLSMGQRITSSVNIVSLPMRHIFGFTRLLRLMPFVTSWKLVLCCTGARFLLTALAMSSSTLAPSGLSMLTRFFVSTVFLVLSRPPSYSISPSLHPIAGVPLLHPSSFVLVRLFGVRDARLEWGSVRLRSVRLHFHFPFPFFSVILVLSVSSVHVYIFSFVLTFLLGLLGLLGSPGSHFGSLLSHPWNASPSCFSYCSHHY